MINNLRLFLKQRLNQPLPGTSAHLKMVPEPLNDRAERRPMLPSAQANSSCVLLLFFPDDQNKLSLIFTLRNQHINHGGQISFPGGRAEADESTEETALREANEEIGINPADINIAGTMSNLFVSVSNNLITPVVGFIDYEPVFKLNPAEVDEAFAVRLATLADKETMTTEQRELHNGAFYNVPFWNVHNVPLWGASAMILSEFMELYNEFKSQK